MAVELWMDTANSLRISISMYKMKGHLKRSISVLI